MWVPERHIRILNSPTLLLRRIDLFVLMASVFLPISSLSMFRDEWVRQVEAEAQAEAALVMERERERERDFVRDQCLDTGEADVLLEEEVCMVALDRLPTTTMVKRNRGAKLDE